VVAALARLAATRHHPKLRQVAHRAGDRRRADLQQLGQLGRGEPAVVVGEERGEHPRGHARHARLRQVLLGRLRGGLDPHRRAELLDRFQLDPRKKGRAYSKGNRQKVALVAALASDVELLVLDEPTSGLDPLMETVFQDCMEEERTAGRTVLLSSHILAEAEKLCDRLSIIREGRVVETGTLAEMRHLTRTLVHADLERPAAGLDKLPGVHDLQVNGTDGTRVSCQVDTAELGGFLRHLSDYGVRDLVSQPPTLEELFLRHYEAATPAGDGQATREGARR